MYEQTIHTALEKQLQVVFPVKRTLRDLFEWGIAVNSAYWKVKVLKLNMFSIVRIDIASSNLYLYACYVG